MARVGGTRTGDAMCNRRPLHSRSSLAALLLFFVYSLFQNPCSSFPIPTSLNDAILKLVS